ncbi:CHAP domain-containing protein [Nonomuraea sp. NPDC050790]|uniref:CHAP domain-containing protein n=1 Tax=Nonomuraea sp. NPDC050790 TaxID=3364371 RepID=UPI0037BE1BB3
MNADLENGIQKLIEVLDAEIGYTEKGSGYTKFGEWYQKNVDGSYDFSNAAWCDMFLAWGADKAGLTEVYGQFAYTPDHAAWFRDQGAWGTRPEPGALVFYDWSGGKSLDGIDHIGIVTKVDGARITTIEGNVDARFAKRKERDQSKVVGYGYPAKTEAAAASRQNPDTPNPDTTPQSPGPEQPSDQAPGHLGPNLAASSSSAKFLAAPAAEPGAEAAMAAPLLLAALAIALVAGMKRRTRPAS